MPYFLTTETAEIWLDNELPYNERKKALDLVLDEFLDAYPILEVGDEEVQKAITHLLDSLR